MLLVAACIYLAIAAALYLFQRKLLYYPTGHDPHFAADQIRIDSGGVNLHGWVMNPGRSDAVIYFGGNAEMISHRRGFFEEVLRDYTVYLVNYRGYGLSEGEPSEAGLFDDALAIYDFVAPGHRRVIAYGRSLGSGVAMHLAAERPLDRLLLLTPYDSVAAVAQRAYPLFPVWLLIKDRFDSAARAAEIDIPVLITSAELDRVIRLPHTLELKRRLTRARLEYRMIEGAAHNDVVDFREYRETVRSFLAAASS